MSNRFFCMNVQRITAVILILILLISFCPVSVHAQDVFRSVPLVIDEKNHFVDMQFVNDTLYCRADQWAQTTDCLWSFNENLKKVSFYYDTPVILGDFNQQAYIEAGNTLWVPFFEAAKITGIFFSGVEYGAIQGYRVTPLAVIYKDMDRMFKEEKYRISELINSLGGIWAIASTAARSYAILSSGLISGFVNAASEKMDQDIYDKIFVELLRTDESLLAALTGFGKELTRLGKAINMTQKSLDEDGAVWELLEKAGFSESEIQKFIWSAAQGAYGDKYLNDLSDLYEADKFTNFLEIMGMIDDLAVSIEADTHTIMAIQEVFKDSNSSYIRNAAQKSISIRTDGKVAALGKFTLDQIQHYLQDQTLNALEDAYDEYYDIGSLDKLTAKILTTIYDNAFSLTDKSNAIMYSEAYSLIQLDLASYYLKHNNGISSDNSLMMHSVALLYLRACLASWKLFEFDGSLKEPIDNAKKTITAEISNLMTYTEEELLQSGTSEECEEAVILFVKSLSEKRVNQNELFNETYWFMSFGQSLGFNYLARFSADGTFLARSAGGLYKDGTYTYSDGKLVIVFDVDGFGYPSTIEYRGDKDGFISLEAYQMQVGEDYYLVTPVSNADGSTARDFNEGLNSYNSIIFGNQEEENTPPDSIPAPTVSADPLSSLHVGDVFSFGSYEQNSTPGADDIQWIILEKASDRMLVISKYLLDSRPYHPRNEHVNWNSCSIRTWLNDSFYHTAFTTTEKERILVTTNTDTASSDHIFLLSIDETERYFPTNADRICQATHYAIERDAYVNSSTGGSWWLLRTPGKDGEHVMSVNSDGTIDYEGGKVASKRGTIRPAMWIQLGLTSGSTENNSSHGNTSSSTSAALADGEYYGYLKSWDNKNVTVELYKFDGWNEEYLYREYTKTGTIKTLDITNSSVVLEWPWSDDGNEMKCQSLGEALNTKIWGGSTTVKENCTMVISFNIKNGAVVKIVILYES